MKNNSINKYNYEERYHNYFHSYLINSEGYYLLRARLAFEKYFDSLDVDKRVLEFGVGLGQNIYCLRNRFGYDISNFAIKFTQKKGIKIYKSISEIPSDFFDIILSCHVLEHTENPFKTIKIIRSKLKKSGKLILVLPKEIHKKSFFKMSKSQHLFAWNFRTVNNLLNRIGFNVIENRTNSGTGYFKLMPLAKISYKLWKISTFLLGMILRRSELIIIAIK